LSIVTLNIREGNMSGALPVPKIIVLEAGEGLLREPIKSADLRWARVEEFLRSRELAAMARRGGGRRGGGRAAAAGGAGVSRVAARRRAREVRA